MSQISGQELRELRVEISLSCTGANKFIPFNAQDALQIAVEDISSSIFLGNCDKMMDDSLHSHDSVEPTDIVEDMERIMHGREGDVKEWEYGSPFQQFLIDIDGISNMLGRGFISEPNSILNKVSKEIQQAEWHEFGVVLV